VPELAVHEQIRAARMASGRDLHTIAQRTGAREEWLRAIDDGRFADLPAGVYARSALRAYAGAIGLNAHELIATCEPELPRLEDPISALARVKGLRRKRHTQLVPLVCSEGGSGIGALAIDASIIGAVLLVVIAATLAMCGIFPSALGPTAAPAFGVTASLLALSYFLVFGGIATATPGERIMGRRIDSPRQESPVTCRDIVMRALRCAGRDVLALVSFGTRAAALASARTRRA
jgi:hypothetical protein